MGGKKRATAIAYEEGLNNFEDDGEEEDYSTDFEGDDEETAQRKEDNVDDAGMDDSGRLRFRANIALEGENYAGKKGSRKAAFDQDGLHFDDADAVELSERLRYSGASEDEDEENASKRNLTGGQEDELEALSREYEKLREEEEKGLEILQGQEKDNQQKGQAVRNQRALWDRSLEMRISLQKMLSSANRLPRKAAQVQLCNENEQIKEAYAKFTDSAVRSLDCLVDLETLLVETNSAISGSYSTMPNGNGKRKIVDEVEGESVSDRAWKSLDELYTKLMPYRDNALDRWQRKTQIYTGAVGKARLRAFNQSVSQQVATTMRDSSRLTSRMRLRRNSVRVLGQSMDNEEQKNLSTKTEEDVEFLRPAKVDDDEGDPETFDDAEFYQQLLREFLESSDPSALGSMSLYATARQHNKKRKQVDRRASKGRKLRYNVFEQLLNFMAPKPMVLPPITTQLFSNLFGHKRVTHNSTS